jgi:iron(III) transport system substrate-binding protein
MAFKSNGCNTIWFYIVSRTPDKGGSAMNGVTLLLFLVTFLAVWEFPTSRALAQTAHHTQLIEGAKKEGQLNWYTSMGASDIIKYVELFTAKYPAIKVNVRRVSGERLVTIITTEHRAGKTLFDVVGSSGIAPSLIKSGIFAKYLSPEYKFFPVGTKDPEGYWADSYTNSIALSYHIRTVPKDKVPQTWEDLLDPRWKVKKIGIDSEPYEWFDSVVRVMGKEKGLSFMKRLGEQELVITRGNNVRAQQLAAGEFPLCFSYAHQIDRMKKDGAPVDWVKSEQLFVVNVLHPLFIAAKAAHPNAARVFVDFALSKDAQQLMASLGRIASRMDVETRAPKTVRAVPEDLSVYDRINEARAEVEKLLFR